MMKIYKPIVNMWNFSFAFYLDEKEEDYWTVSEFESVLENLQIACQRLA